MRGAELTSPFRLMASLSPICALLASARRFAPCGVREKSISKTTGLYSDGLAETLRISRLVTIGFLLTTIQPFILGPFESGCSRYATTSHSAVYGVLPGFADFAALSA